MLIFNKPSRQSIHLKFFRHVIIRRKQSETLEVLAPIAGINALCLSSNVFAVGYFVSISIGPISIQPDLPRRIGFIAPDTMCTSSGSILLQFKYCCTFMAPSPPPPKALLI